MKRNTSSPAGLASRRAFLRTGLAGGAAALGGPALAAGAGNPANQPPNVADWTRTLGEGVAARAYGKPSKHEAHVGRRDVAWLTASPQSSVSFTPLHEIDGIITPNGLCFERHHSGIAEVDPGDYRLMLHGMVDRPLIFTLDDLKRMPRVNRAYFCECAANSGMEWRGAQLNGCQYTHGMVHCVMYTGVPLKVLLNEAGLKPKAKWLLMEGGDSAAMTRSLPLAKALDDALVAYRMNGEMLYPENGYPVRMVLPGWEANMWVKWLRRIEVGDQPWHTREETSKYTDLLENGKARRFTYLMEAKSVITSPSPQAPIHHRSGFTVLSGIAWSGRGKIARVDISLDGGRNWRAARIDGPAWDKALTRFYYEFDWDGSELLLQSRAMDETGYVQPSKAELRKVRGVNSIYHNNGIQTWHLHKNGEVENVEVSKAAGLGLGMLAFAGASTGMIAAAPKSSAERPPAAVAPAKHLGIGRPAKPDEIAGWDIDIRPDGQGLPLGKGTVKQGEQVYMQQCAACHGEFGESAGRWPILSGGAGTLASHDPVKSIGSYWPYASTVMDYIRRSMPFGNAQSLTNDELYAVTAYVFYLNDIIKDENFELNEKSFKSIRLPNEPNFHDDDREVSEKSFWRKAPCMKNCLPGKATITGRARVIDVTPEPGKGPKVE